MRGFGLFKLLLVPVLCLGTVFLQDLRPAFYAITAYCLMIIAVELRIKGFFPSAKWAFYLGLIWVIALEIIINYDVIIANTSIIEAKHCMRMICFALWTVISTAELVSFNDVKPVPPLKNFMFSNSPIAIPSLCGLVILYIIFKGSDIITGITLGRTVRLENAESNLLGGVSSFTLSTIIISIIPAATLVLLAAKEKLITTLFFIIITLPTLFILISTGTRFLLLFTLSGVMSLLFVKFRIKLNLLHTACVLFTCVIVLLITSTMLQFRQEGLKDVRSPVTTREKHIWNSEDAVLQSVNLMALFDRIPHTHGRFLSMYVLRFIPRAVWQDKPESLGMWFIPAWYGNDAYRRYSIYQNFAFGYWGDAYADFGMAGMIGISIVFGWLFAFVDKLTCRIAVLSKPWLILYLSFVPGFAFFFARSPDTTSEYVIIALCITFGMGKLCWNMKSVHRPVRTRRMQ